MTIRSFVRSVLIGVGVLLGIYAAQYLDGIPLYDPPEYQPHHRFVP